MTWTRVRQHGVGSRWAKRFRHVYAVRARQGHGSGRRARIVKERDALQTSIGRHHMPIAESAMHPRVAHGRRTPVDDQRVGAILDTYRDDVVFRYLGVDMLACGAGDDGNTGGVFSKRGASGSLGKGFRLRVYHTTL